MILKFLFPAHEYSPEAIEPAMSSLDDPTSGLFSATAFGVFGFIPSRLDVSDLAVNSFDHLSDYFGIIAFVQRDVFLQTIL
jgi:hypothetical protein